MINQYMFFNDLSYDIWKQIVDNNNFQVYYLLSGTEKASLFAGNKEQIYCCYIDSNTWTNFSIDFPPENIISVKTDNDAIAQIVGLSNIVSHPNASDGSSYVQIRPLEGSQTNQITPNWCDKTTWYYTSERVEEASYTGSGTEYSLEDGEKVFVDVSHGKITHENLLQQIYQPVVYLDGVEQEENSPEQTDNDYDIDYDTGNIVFNNTVSGVVTADYSYVTSSEWRLVPSSGKKLRIKDVEVQLSKDGLMKDDVEFAIYGIVGMMPALEPYRQANGGPLPDGYEIPLMQNTVYKTLNDFVNESNGSYPIISAFGGNSWRSLKQDIYIFRWEYKTTKDLRADWGMSLKVYLSNDIPHSGTLAATTFYCVSEDL